MTRAHNVPPVRRGESSKTTEPASLAFPDVKTDKREGRRLSLLLLLSFPRILLLSPTKPHFKTEENEPKNPDV